MLTKKLHQTAIKGLASLLLGTCILLSGCGSDAQGGALLGAGAGAAAGAIIGHQSGSTGEGAAIGAGAGALLGYIIGNESDKEKEQDRKRYRRYRRYSDEDNYYRDHD